VGRVEERRPVHPFWKSLPFAVVAAGVSSGVVSR
jgi:hypothetical protein